MENQRIAALNTYKKKLMDHREIESKLKKARKSIIGKI